MSDTALATRTYEGVTIPIAGTFALDVAHSRVGFVARHLMVSKVRGAFGEFEGAITVADNPLESSVTATIKTASFDSGSADRDNHVRSGDFLDVEKYPELTFVSTRVTEVDGSSFTLLGDLTIKDITREVALKVDFEGVAKSPWGQEVIAFSAVTEIDREDFGITWNLALETGGVVVGKKVKIEIEAEAVRQN